MNIYKNASGTKEYRVLVEDHQVKFKTDEDRMCDTWSYKTVPCKVQTRDAGKRSWNRYSAFGCDTVEQAERLVAHILAENARLFAMTDKEALANLGRLFA